MAQPPVCDFGWKAPDFTLPATDGKTYGLARLKGQRGTVVSSSAITAPTFRPSSTAWLGMRVILTRSA
jgi:hypothetical protein